MFSLRIRQYISFDFLHGPQYADLVAFAEKFIASSSPAPFFRAVDITCTPISTHPPTPFQHDYFLHHCLAHAGDQVLKHAVASGSRVSPDHTIKGYVLNIFPNEDAQAARILIRTLAGREDFARVNGHNRRHLTNLISSDLVERTCFYCMMHGERLLKTRNGTLFPLPPTVPSA